MPSSKILRGWREAGQHPKMIWVGAFMRPGTQIFSGADRATGPAE